MLDVPEEPAPVYLLVFSHWIIEGGEGSMGKAIVRVGRPVARIADGLRYSRDRRRRVRQFHRVTRVTLRDD
jgi:hypothetical protein